MSELNATTPNKHVRSPDFVETTASTIRVALSPFNFTLIFGLNDDKGPGEIIPTDKVALNVSPHTAKFFAIQMHAIISAYEEVYGNLVMPNITTAAIEAGKPNLVELFRNSHQPTGNTEKIS